MRSLFYKKLKCQCGSYFKGKNYRSRKVYLCTHVEKGLCDKRIPIEENFIKDLCFRRLGQVSDDEMVNKLDYVLVRGKWDMDVFFKEDSVPMIIKGIFNHY